MHPLLISGIPAIRKVAEGPADAERLERERGWLGRAAHPGVVATLPSGGDGSICTREVGARTLRDCGALPPAELAGLGSAAATILADLHDLGIVHGAPTADHVLIDDAGRPVFCSFGDAADADAVRAARDVRVLAEALAAQVPARGPRALRRVLRRAADPGRPLAARTLATRLARAVPEPRLPAVLGGRHTDVGPGVAGCLPQEPAGPQEPPAPRRGEAPSARPGGAGRRVLRPEVLAGATLAGLLVAVGIGSWMTAWPAVQGRGTGPQATARRPPPPPGVPCPAVDAGCGPLRLRHGVFTAHGGRWALSAPGDVVVLGRWTCGPALPAALDRRDGSVWVFSRWGVATGRLAAEVPGATSLRVLPGRGGCDAIVLLVAGRPTREVLPSAIGRPGGETPAGRRPAGTSATSGTSGARRGAGA